MESPLNKSPQIGSLLLADLKRVTERMKRDLQQTPQQGISSIDEDQFVRFFLPLFAGELKDDASTMRSLLDYWYQIAGNAFRPVNVVSNGRVVAVVPPIRSNFLTGAPQVDQPGHAGDILQDAAHYATISPKGAQNLIATSLHKRYMRGIPKPDLTEHQKAWYDLLSHYGKAPKQWMVGQPEATQQPSQAASGDDGFDFD